MNYYSEARKAVDLILKSTSLTQGEISMQAGYAEQSLTQMLSAKDVSEKMYKNILKQFLSTKKIKQILKKKFERGKIVKKCLE